MTLGEGVKQDDQRRQKAKRDGEPVERQQHAQSDEALGDDEPPGGADADAAAGEGTPFGAGHPGVDLPVDIVIVG